jgi:hypothetical protein
MAGQDSVVTWAHQSVGVDLHHVLTGGVADPEIVACPLAYALFQVDQLYSRIGLDDWGIWLVAIDHGHDLDITHRALESTIYGLLKVVFTATGDDHRDATGDGVNH